MDLDCPISWSGRNEFEYYNVCIDQIFFTVFSALMLAISILSAIGVIYYAWYEEILQRLVWRESLKLREWLPLIIIARDMACMVEYFIRLSTGYTLADQYFPMSLFHLIQLFLFWNGCALILYFHTMIFSALLKVKVTKIVVADRTFGSVIFAEFCIFQAGTVVAILFPYIIKFNQIGFYFSLIGIHTLFIGICFQFFGYRIVKFHVESSSATESIRLVQKRIMAYCTSFAVFCFIVTIMSLLIVKGSTGILAQIRFYDYAYMLTTHVVLCAAFFVFTMGLGTRRWDSGSRQFSTQSNKSVELVDLDITHGEFKIWVACRKY